MTKRWVVSKLETPTGPEWHVLDGTDPDVVSWFCGTQAEAEAWVAKRTRKNAAARARNQAMRDLGLTKTPYGWE